MLQGSGVKNNIDSFHHTKQFVLVSNICYYETCSIIIRILLVLEEKLAFIVVYTSVYMNV